MTAWWCAVLVKTKTTKKKRIFYLKDKLVFSLLNCIMTERIKQRQLPTCTCGWGGASTVKKCVTQTHTCPCTRGATVSV